METRLAPKRRIGMITRGMKMPGVLMLGSLVTGEKMPSRSASMANMVDVMTVDQTIIDANTESGRRRRNEMDGKPPLMRR